jgi:hypothetical protein
MRRKRRKTETLWFVITDYLTISLQTVADRLDQGKRSDCIRGSVATTAAGAERRKQVEQSDYSRGSEATTAGGVKQLQQGE